MNPLRQTQIHKLDTIGFADLRRKITEIIDFCNATEDRLTELEGKDKRVESQGFESQPIGSTCDDTPVNEEYQQEAHYRKDLIQSAIKQDRAKTIKWIRNSEMDGEDIGAIINYLQK